ncbi:MAG: protein kinase [Porcipelethomonas sp.]
MFRQNDIIGGMYRVIKEIGHGGIGVIYLAEHLRLKKYVVIKKIKNDFNGSIEARNEVDILKNLHHTYLPQVYDFYQEGTQIFTVIDFVEGHDLEWYLKQGYSFDEGTVKKWLYQLCTVVNYLHCQDPPVLHSDIKPANIMITSSGNICLIDFNISLDMNDAIDLSGFSRNYASPEQYIRFCQLTNGSFMNLSCPIDQRTDIYGIGTTFYSLMTHKLPDVINGQLPISKLNVNYSEGLCKIIEKAMDPDYSKRYASVKKMLRDIENMYKLEKGYKKYFLLQLAALAAGGCLIIGGVGTISKGINVQNKERFEKEYSVFCRYYDSGNNDLVQETGTKLVNDSDYSSVFEDNPQLKSEMFYYMATSCYNNEEYERALDIYRYAIKNCKSRELIGDYYRDYTICLINAGQEKEAEKIIVLSDEYGISDDETKLINAELKYQKGDKKSINEASALVSELTSSGNLDDENLYRAYMLGADIYEKTEDYDKEIEMLDKASCYFSSNAMYRRYASAYSSAAQGLYDKQKKENLKKARGYYYKIIDSGSANEKDYINLGYAYNGLECYDNEYMNYLNEAIKKYPEQFRFYMLRALYNYKTGSQKKFSEDYLKASRLYGEMTEFEQGEVQESEKNMIISERGLYESFSKGLE